MLKFYTAKRLLWHDISPIYVAHKNTPNYTYLPTILKLIKIEY